MDIWPIVRGHLQAKFAEIKSRMLSVIAQLDEADLNWRPIQPRQACESPLYVFNRARLPARGSPHGGGQPHVVL